MMKYLITIGLSLTLAGLVHAGPYATPRFGGGYNFYNQYGQSEGSASPRFGGGYNFSNQFGQSQGYMTPRFGGGYNFYNQYGQ